MPDDDSMHRIAYLAGQYPAVSHTFILREVQALKALGVEILTCSIRRTGLEHLRGPDEEAAAAETFYVQDTARKIWPLIIAQKAAMVTPGRYFGALRLALQTRAPGLKSMIYQIFYFAEATLLAQKLRDQGVAHLHSHFAQAGTSVAMLTAHLAGIPFSFTLHGPADLDAPHDWHLSTKVARARFVACISHYARSQAMRHTHPEHWGKLKIIHCGVVPALYDRPDYADHVGTRLLFVGRLSQVKGVAILLDALKEALATVPDLHLTIIGDGPDRPALFCQAKSLGDAVTFAGYQSQTEVADHLAASDILVLPSFAEGVPVVLMEAMASARPVICTQVAGVSELVVDGVSGRIVPPGDADALRHAILELASDPTSRSRMGQAGREAVRDAFDARVEAARLATLLLGGVDTPIRPKPVSDLAGR